MLLQQFEISGEKLTLSRKTDFALQTLRYALGMNQEMDESLQSVLPSV